MCITVRSRHVLSPARGVYFELFAYKSSLLCRIIMSTDSNPLMNGEEVNATVLVDQDEVQLVICVVGVTGS